MFIYIDPTTGIAILSVGGWIWVVLLFIGGSFAFFAKKILNFLKKYKYYCLFLFFLLSLGIVMFFCSPKKINPITKKIIILGLDGPGEPLSTSSCHCLPIFCFPFQPLIMPSSS